MSRLIAVGDIHGEYDKFLDLLEKVKPQKIDKFVFLGDYIDRGEGSKQVVDELIKLSNFCDCEFLMGNHEYYLLRSFEGEETCYNIFMTYGGVQTCASYGGFDRIEETHGDFYKNLKRYYMTEEYFFVHGGLVPNVDIEKQDLYSTLMIRDEFIYHPVTIKQKVVFGHTPFEKPLVQVDKIGIDTGSGKFEKSYITALICGSEDFVFSM